jgi:PAS domain S-box-containing protein
VPTVNSEAQAVLFNAVPLLIVAALYLYVGAARLRTIGRERALGLEVAGVAAVIAGVTVLLTRDPLAGQALVSLAAIALAAVPAVLVLRADTAAGTALSQRSFASGPLSQRLLDAEGEEGIARVLLDELVRVFELDLANLAVIEGGGRRARVVAARDGGRDNERLVGQELDLEQEASGVSTATREGTAFAVFDAESSPIVNQRLNQIARIKSCAFVPMLAGGQVVGVVFGGVRQPRLFGDDELAQMQALAAEAGLALGKTRASAALAEALERERLVAHISRKVRSLRDLDELLRVAVEETAKAIRVERCFIRLGEPGEKSPVVAQWLATGVTPLEDVMRLPIVNVAARERRTVVVADVLEAPEASDTTVGYVRELAEIGSRAVLAVPIISFGTLAGVLALHRAEPGAWAPGEISLVEAVAHETAIAIDTSRLLRESTRQAQVERGFYRIAAVLSEPLSAEATHDAVAQAAAEALGGDSAAVLRTLGDELELAGSYELADVLVAHLRESAAALTTFARSGKLLASRRLLDDGRFGEELGRAAEAAGRRSLLAVPLPEPSGRGAGLVLVFYAAEESFDDEQLVLAERVAGAARGALERSELYERERRSRALAQRLAKAGRELAGELDPDNVLDQAVGHAVQLLVAEGASARMLEEDEVVVRAATGLGEGEVLGAVAPSTGFLVGDIVQTRSTRAVADVRTDPRLAEADPMLAAGYVSYLGVPMIGPEESVQGILAVYDGRPREWLEEEAEALHALGAATAAARANAELYQGVSHDQQRSEAILANVADGIVAVDRDGKVVLWNTAAERVTGVPQADALGRTPLQALGRPLEAGEGILGGSRLVPIRRGGEEVWLSLSEAVMTDPAGAVAGRIYAFRDISAERSVEQMKSDFVSTVSHELRTPLTSIYGFAETLLRQDVLFGEEERATFLRYIASESERLTAIVDRLLSVAQLDTGDMAVQLAETDVGAVVSEAVRSLESGDVADGHRFVVALSDEPLAAAADRDKLGQVLAHLLDNAIRYSPAGGTVTVAARRREDAVEVSVEDEGVGIPHAEQERIFRKFYRGDAAAGAVGAGATGLGLFLAEGLVTAMGGRIWVDSDEGRGSTFVLELRAAESET